MTTSLGIIGAGGFGREVLEYIGDAAADGWRVQVAGFLDDRLEARDGCGDEPSIVGAFDHIEISSIDHFVIAVGDAGMRRSLARRVVAAGKMLSSVIHPTSYVSRSAIVGTGTVLAPFSMIGAHASVGINTSVNVYGSIGHDSKIGAHNVVSPYVALTGAVRVGETCFFGTHAIVAPRVNLGSFSQVAAGSYVRHDAPSGSLLAGSPAKGRVMFPVICDEG